MRVTMNLFPNGKKRCLTMSYDDGVRHDAHLIEIFDKYGIKGTFHLNTNGIYNEKPDKNIQYNEVADVYRNHEVSMHSVSHPHLDALPHQGIVNEIWHDKEVLESLVSYPVRGMSYPMGSYSPEVLSVLRGLGVEYARTVRSTHQFELPMDYLEWHPTCHHREDVKGLWERFQKLNTWWEKPYLFYIWGHAYELEENTVNNNWTYMEDLCKMFSEDEDVWFASNIDIVNYINAVRSLRFSADCKMIYNPSAQDVWVAVDRVPLRVEKGKLIHI